MIRKFWGVAAIWLCLLYSCPQTTQAVVTDNPVYGILGPINSPPGILCRFRAEIPEGATATWVIVPCEYADCLYIDTSGVAIAFSNPIAGIYHFIMATIIDGEVVVFTHELEQRELGPEPEPEPKPDPNPDPVPPPGKRFVLIIYETGEPTKQLGKTLTGLRRYLREEGHKWRMEDQDLKDSKTDETPSWFQVYLDRLKEVKVNIPAIIVGAFSADGKTVVNLRIESLPDDAVSAIQIVKDHGG